MMVKQQSSTFPLNRIFILYYLCLLALLAASFFPDIRIWGLNSWGHFPYWVIFGLFGIGALLPLILKRADSVIDSQSEKSILAGRFYMLSGIISGALISLFYLLRARTFYLGDGYTVLSLLAADVPLVKKRDLGEALIHVWINNLTGLEGEAGSLLSFQIISIGAGLLILSALIYLAVKLFTSNSDRLMFFLMMTAGGYMMLFFGYVENYSLFVTSIMLYCLTGLLIVRGRINRWWSVLFAGLSCFFHVFGVALIPSMVYLLLNGTSMGLNLSRLNIKTKWLLITTIVLGIGAVFFHFYFNIYYFRFAMVPLWPDQFTIDGYWLFSFNHLLDIVNLLLLLLPALPLVLVIFLRSDPKKLWRDDEYRFLLFVLMGTLAEVFIFDPKLGLARDWDLFSLVGVPLTLLGAWVVLDKNVLIPRRRLIVGLVVTLGFLVLIPRVVTQVQHETGFAWFRSYTNLDLKKSMYARAMLKEHYENIGDSVNTEKEFQRYCNDYPGWIANRNGLKMQNAGNCREAIPLFEKAISINPLHAAAYSNLAMCLRNNGKLDSALALFKIAAGLNPFNATMAKEVGATYFYKGQLEKAEYELLRALEIDKNNGDALLGLMQLYTLRQQNEQALIYLKRLAQHPNAPLQALKELGEYYLLQHDFKNARIMYLKAIPLGLDTAYLRSLKQKIPQLGL